MLGILITEVNLKPGISHDSCICRLRNFQLIVPTRVEITRIDNPLTSHKVGVQHKVGGPPTSMECTRDCMGLPDSEALSQTSWVLGRDIPYHLHTEPLYPVQYVTKLSKVEIQQHRKYTDSGCAARNVVSYLTSSKFT